LSTPHAYTTSVFDLSASNFGICLYRGGFRHVQHVRPNRGLTKRDPRGGVNFCNITTCRK